jgi:serine/threonine protein kinase
LSPHFIYTFFTGFCNNCLYNAKKFKCSLTIIELVDGVLQDVKDEKIQYNMLFQMLHSLYVIHTLYGLCHNDIKKENFLMSMRPKGGFTKYRIDDKVYTLENLGFMIFLADFGTSRIMSPDYGGIDLGFRYAKVVNDKFVPFTTKQIPSIDKRGKVTAEVSRHLVGRSDLTMNRFYKGFDSKPSIPVDLNNFQEFPTRAMYLDIQDVLKTFVGGKRETQPEDHKGMKLSANIHRKLSTYIEKLDIRYPWPTNRVELFLANKLIYKLFKP